MDQSKGDVMQERVEDLDALLKTLSPKVRAGKYVFACVDEYTTARLRPIVSVREVEGTTVVVELGEAIELRLVYDFISAWITLDVHSSLDAVGLTATVSRVLTDEGISANVVAGFHHDHIFVPHDRAEDAVECLRKLTHSG
ncbi:ACT domain-containing protein [Rhodococcus fascians]|nr:ACT domain-containing protein [Rhodococcus fascians]MBY4114711.1 ACT domain-containing protein [Rhodococcus fascians]